jgi:Xaa-Pro aminopeptidase
MAVRCSVLMRRPEGDNIDRVNDSEAAISVDEYAARRSALLDALEGAVGLVLAGSPTSSSSLGGRWYADPMFRYLTGLDHESGAAVLFDPSAEDPARRITLLLRPRDIEAERWDGAREPLDSGLKSKTGFTSLKRAPSLPGMLSEAAQRTKRLACLHPFAAYTADVSPDLDIFHKVVQRIPGVSLEDRTQLLLSMRAVKSAAEVALIERASAATAAGFAASLQAIRPGIREKDIVDLLVSTYRSHDCEPAYELIVASGLNGTVLHYTDNNAACAEGDLIVMDCAAAYRGYASDVTRTLPVAGVFTAEQRDVYEIVLAAELAGIAAATPGATYTDVDAAARAVIEHAGYGDAFIHGTSHPIGLDVHDVSPHGPLKPGMVITVEPGIYLPDRGFGVRIEDDVLITAHGNRELTSAIPRTVEAIEQAMRR